MSTYSLSFHNNLVLQKMKQAAAQIIVEDTWFVSFKVKEFIEQRMEFCWSWKHNLNEFKSLLQQLRRESSGRSTPNESNFTQRPPVSDIDVSEK